MPYNQMKETPYFAVDLSKITDTYISLYDAFSKYKIDGILAYSVKANYCAPIISKLNQLGCCFEVCSDYEINLLMNLGINFNKIIINGHINNIETMALALNYGAIILVGSLNELDRLCAVFERINKTRPRIGLRLNLDYIKDTAKGFYSLTSRFGIPIEYWEHTVDIIKRKQLHIECVQAHFSGNSRDPFIYSAIVKEIVSFIKKFQLTSSMIDVGGGFKIGENFWSFNDYIYQISQAMDYDIISNKLIVELGNAIVRESCTYFTKVIDVYQIGQKKYVLVDGSTLHLYGTGKNINFEYRLNLLHPSIELMGEQYVVGNTCKESDLFFILRNEPLLSIGDTVILHNVGAYTINNIPSFILQKPNIIFA